MSVRKDKANGTILALWRSPQGAGDPLGCLATTFTFDAGFFDEQCLARFLEIDSEPDREDLAFLLERETRLGTIYAGVLVDHSQAGVEHSLRWDVLPIRIPHGKQHAKISVLAWTHHVRILITSANLTQYGYRYNREVAGAIDLMPTNAPASELSACCDFLESLLGFVPGASQEMREVQRAREFLDRVRRLTSGWAQSSKHQATRQHAVFSLPGADENPATGSGPQEPLSALDTSLKLCRSRGGSPGDIWVASPFFDPAKATDSLDEATAAVCKSMVRGGDRRIILCIPAVGDATAGPVRLAAPISLLRTARRYVSEVQVEVLPQRDDEKNLRPWHAKMLGLSSGGYNALLIGSSNFTKAGLGIGPARNAEANLLYLVDRESYAKGPGLLDSLWPEMDVLDDPDKAEWLGPQEVSEEEEQAKGNLLPSGFLAASYRAGDSRMIILRLDSRKLPPSWRIEAYGRNQRVLIDQEAVPTGSQQTTTEIPWEPIEPPQKLLVRWDSGEAFWPLNVEDASHLPPPEKLERMSADDLLLILAASDPGGALRVWARQHSDSTGFDDELDSATPPDLDPLRRYDLQETFLKRVGRRASILARVRQNLERPVWSDQALEWRLRGLVGIDTLATRMLREFREADGRSDEALLTLADLLVVLDQVQYKAEEGAVSAAQFKRTYRDFLAELAERIDQEVSGGRQGISRDLLNFWERVVHRCQ
jgi:hypothetical protein